MNDGDGWIVVLRRKPSSHSSTAASGTKRRSGSLGSPSPACPSSLQHGHQEEKQILVRLNRSIQRVEQSEFYKKFLEQLRSPCVMDNIRRAAASAVQGHNANAGSSASGSSVHNCSRQQADAEADSATDPNQFWPCELQGKIDRLCDLLAHGGTWEGKKLGSAVGEETCIACNGTGETNWQLDIVVYGLGSIADSEVSRCQFSLVLLLRRTFRWVGRIEIYDPVLSPLECKVIQALHCCIIAVNEEGKRVITRPTLFYMPHCEEWLYDNVLSVNWSPSKLRNLILLGNSFKVYQEKWSSLHTVRSTPPPTFLLRSQKYSREIPIENTSFLHLPVFNDISWHFFMLESDTDTDFFQGLHSFAEIEHQS